MINNNFIKIRNLSKSYEVNYNKLTIINELSLDLQKNCIVSIGSTLADLIAGKIVEKILIKIEVINTIKISLILISEGKEDK